MITIAVCDDDINFARLLTQRLQKNCIYSLPERVECQVAPPFFSASDVTEYLMNNTIDVLFLDIDMPEKNGFELAKTLCQFYQDIIIVFVSAYDDFVYSSFEYCPFRFLRKSHLNKELDITFQKIIEKCILDKETVLFNTTDGEKTIAIKDILYFEGQRNYYFIYTRKGETYKCRGTMESLEKEMTKYDFFRVHSAYIVNEEHIESVSNKGYVIMKNDKLVSVSKRRMNDFRSAYMEFIRRRVTK